MTEKVFQTQLLTVATWYGWHAQHTRPAQYRNGRWATPIQGKPGFPDLVLCHRTRGLIFVELKSKTGRLSDAQREWLDLLEAAGQECYVWRPDDFQTAADRLGGYPPERTTQ